MKVNNVAGGQSVAEAEVRFLFVAGGQRLVVGRRASDFVKVNNVARGKSVS